MTAEKMFNSLGWQKTINKCKTVLDYTKIIDEGYEKSIIIDLEDRIAEFYINQNHDDSEFFLNESEIKAFCKLIKELGIGEK